MDSFGLMLLVRHGHVAVPDNEGRFHSEGEVPLSERGREQAARLGERLAELSIDRLCASDMPRAVETARIVGGVIGLPVETFPALREVNCGHFDGSVLADLERDNPEFVPWIRAGFLQGFATAENHFRADLRFPGGESVLDLAERVTPVFRRLCEESAGRVTVVVSHAWAVSVMLCHVLGLHPSGYFRFGLPNTGVSIARVGTDGRGMLDAVNVGTQWDALAGGAVPLAVRCAS